MYEFFHDNHGKCLEGYLSSKESFNGIVFLLKEPNNTIDPNAPDNIFWFKNAVYKQPIFKETDTPEKKRKSKKAATTYTNRFKEMLIATGLADENTAPGVLKNIVYCNIHPEFGEKTASEDYHDTKKPRLKLFLESFPKEHETLTIFTVSDAYDIFLEYLKPVDEESKFGLYYNNAKQKRCFRTKHGSCDLIVCELIHPTYSPKIDAETKPSYCKHN